MEYLGVGGLCFKSARLRYMSTMGSEVLVRPTGTI